MPGSPAKNRWPLFLALLGLFFFGLTSWSVYRAQSGVSGIIDRDYYSHGLKYNDSLVEQRAAASLGWDVQLEVVGSSFHVYLSAQNKSPVGGAHAQLVLYPNQPDQRVNIPLEETMLGRYQGQLPPHLAGSLPVQLQMERDGVRLERGVVLNF